MVGGPKGDGYSGADLAALVREAGVRALRRALSTLEEMDSHPGHSSGSGTGVAAATVDADADAGERERKDAVGVAARIFTLLWERLLLALVKLRDAGMRRCARHLRAALGGGKKERVV
jgi:SpoVK/Ycf46/Vps4 family AAA+-type ATPase